MRARRFVPLMAAAFLLVPALPASAHISSFTVEDAHGNQGGGGMDWDEVHGRITCTAGEKFLVTAKIIDDPYRGKGWTRGTCTGESQVWTVQMAEEPHGVPLGDGCWERVRAKAHTKINGIHHDEAVDTLPPNCA